MGKGTMKIKNIIYEIKDGKGYRKIFNKENRLIFEGEYLNGQNQGKGKEYYYSGDLQFDGNYVDGQKNGKG